VTSKTSSKRQSVASARLVNEVHAAPAATLLATITETATGTPELADRPIVPRHGRRTRRANPRRARVRVLAVAAALAVAVVLSTAAFGVGRDVASFFAGWLGSDAPAPTAPDVVIASGEAGGGWQIVATTSQQGLGLATAVAGEDAVLGSCAPTDVRGDPWTDEATHSIGAFSTGGGFARLDRTFAFGPLAQDVASVELVLSGAKRIHAHIVKQPKGFDAPLNFYWATWPCGSCGGRRGRWWRWQSRVMRRATCSSAGCRLGAATRAEIRADSLRRT
jgi:hypothetical protein